jgi:hypothetical protein
LAIFFKASKTLGHVRESGENAFAVNSREELFSMPGDYVTYVVFGASDDSLSDLTEEIALICNKDGHIGNNM